MYGATTVESDFSPGRKSIVQPKNYYSLFHESVTSEQWNCFDVLRLLELSNQAVISACISRTMRLQLIVSQKLSFLNYIANDEVNSWRPVLSRDYDFINRSIIFYFHLSILYAMQFLPLLVINAKAAMIETGDRQA